MRLPLVVLTVFAASCSKEGKKSATSTPTKIPKVDGKAADEIWNMTPNEAIAGIVVLPGAWQRAVILRTEATAVMQAMPQEMKNDLGGFKHFENMNSEAIAGIDVGAGGASFFIPGGEYVRVKVKDINAFAAALEAKVEGNKVVGEMYCEPTDDGWYHCISGGAAALSKLSFGQSKLAERAKSTFAKQGRGDVEFFRGGDSTTSLSLRFARGKVRGKLAFDGVPDDAFPMESVPNGRFARYRDGSTSYLSTKVPTQFLQGMQLPGVDTGALTGEMAIVTGGRAEIALIAGATDADQAKAFATSVCTAAMQMQPLLAQQMPGTTIEKTKTGCKAKLALPNLPQLAMLGKMDSFFVEHDGNDVILRTPTLQTAAKGPKAPADTKAMFARDHTAVFWFQPLFGPGLAKDVWTQVMAGMGPSERKLMPLMMTSFLRVHDAGVFANKQGDAVSLDFHVTLVADDEPAVYQAYQTVLDAVAKSDMAAASDALAALAKKHPNSLAADAYQAKPTSMAVIGMAAAVAIPAFVKYGQAAKASEYDINAMAIADGAVVFYESPRAAGNGLTVAQPSLPKSVARFPAGPVTCDKKSANQDWSSFDELKFEIYKPFLGHYSFENKGSYGLAIVEYDTDCDGQVGMTQVRIDVSGGSARRGMPMKVKPD